MDCGIPEDEKNIFIPFLNHQIEVGELISSHSNLSSLFPNK